MRELTDLDDAGVERLFRVDGAGPAPPIDPARADAMIDAALDAVLGPAAGGAGGEPGAAAPSTGGGAATSGGVSAAWWGAIGAVVVAGAAVTLWLVTRAPAAPAPEAPAPPAPTAQAGAPGPAPTPDAAPAPAPPLPDEVEILVDDVEDLPAPVAPARDPSPPKRARPAPDDLLKQANEARRQKAWQAADALYARVWAEYPGTAAAQVALVASGTIQLEHQRAPRVAIARFREALRGGGGGVAEEARYGLAEAYRAVGDAARERRALDDFLRHHAGSPLADRARDRRAELGE